MEFEALVVAQCDALVAAVKTRKEQLLQNIIQEKEQKQRVYREQVNYCTARLQRSTGLLQFSIEVLKESDPAAFLQVGKVHIVATLKYMALRRWFIIFFAEFFF